jgi:hypothetical protein
MGLFKDWMGSSGTGWIDSSGLDLFFRGTIGFSGTGLVFRGLEYVFMDWIKRVIKIFQDIEFPAFPPFQRTAYIY